MATPGDRGGSEKHEFASFVVERPFKVFKPHERGRPLGIRTFHHFFPTQKRKTL
jgi:hypothetical protein